MVTKYFENNFAPIRQKKKKKKVSNYQSFVKFYSYKRQAIVPHAETQITAFISVYCELFLFASMTTYHALHSYQPSHEYLKKLPRE